MLGSGITMEKKVDIDKSGHALDVLEQLNNFRKSKKHCDFIIKAGTEECPVHRCVISSCSEYFDAMLTHDTKENRDGVVEIKGVDSECVMECVDFMYTGEASVSDEKQGDLMLVADMMRLHRLYNGVALFLEKKLDCQSFFTTRQIANTYDCKKLIAICNEFALNNFRKLVHLEGFKELEEAYLGFLLTSKDLKESDGAKCKALMVWVNHDSSRTSSLFDMLKHIDFMKVSMSYTKFLVDKENGDIFTASPLCCFLHSEHFFFLQDMSNNIVPAVSTSSECLKLLVESLNGGQAVTAKDFSMDDKLGIIVFNRSNSKLEWLDVEKKTQTEIQPIQSLGDTKYSAVAFDDYIYAFLSNCATYRLNFVDSNASWEKMANNSRGHGHAIVLGGLIYLTNHGAHSNLLERYDPVGNQWSFTPNKSQTLGSSTLAVAGGKLFVIGGSCRRGLANCTVNNVERFDPITSLWSDAASLRQERRHSSAATLDDSIYVFGGACESGCVQSIEILHASANSWELVDMPNLNRNSFNTVAFDGGLYLVGGNTARGPRTIGRFDPRAKKITTIMNLNFNLTGYTSVATYG